MCNLSVCTLLLVFAATCYVSGSTKASSNDDDDDEFLQAINLANSPNISPKPYTPIQEQQKQQQHEKLRQHPNKGSLLASEAATMKTRQKRSQHGLTNSEQYLRNMPTYAYNLALLNIMQSLRKQLTNIELARLRSHLGRTAAADLQLFNEIYNNNNYNNRATLFNDESATLNVGELGGSNDNGSGGGDMIGFAAGATGLIGGTDTGHGELGMLGGVGAASAATDPGNDMLANDIEDLSVPWQFVGRVSKKSSALYKPRLGKRTQKRQQQQEPISCN